MQPKALTPERLAALPPLPTTPLPGQLGDLKVVFLNGPAGSGKDTAGRALADFFSRSEVMKMARRLKESVHADYGGPHLPHDYFEATKDEPSGFFFGKSPRQAYIDKSEKMVKGLLGKDFYGRVFNRDLLAAYLRGIELVFITDSGFVDECTPVLTALTDSDDALLICIRADGRGKSFRGDSRSYIDLPGIETVWVTNDGDQEAFEQAVIDIVFRWLTGMDRNAPPPVGWWDRLQARALDWFTRLPLGAVPA